MSALTHIDKAIQAVRSGDGAIDGRMSPGSREAKALWYLVQARECLSDNEPVVADPTEEVEAGKSGAESISALEEGVALEESLDKNSKVSAKVPTSTSRSVS